MRAHAPLIVLSLVLSAFVTGAKRSDRLDCSYSDSYFRVSDGQNTWEKYIGNWDGKEAKLECGEKIAAGLIGSYFVFFTDGKIKDLYVGSFDESRRLIQLQGNVAAAIDGAYFVTARAGGEIVQKHIGTTTFKPQIAVSRDLAAAMIGNYFVASDGVEIQQKYVGGGEDTQLVAGGNFAAALAGNYFVAFVGDRAGGKIVDKYVGTRSVDDELIRGKDLAAASFGNYFVVLDPKRGTIVDQYIGNSGKVSVMDDVAVHQSPNGKQVRYSLTSGKFD